MLNEHYVLSSSWMIWLKRSQLLRGQVAPKSTRFAIRGGGDSARAENRFEILGDGRARRRS